MRAACLLLLLAGLGCGGGSGSDPEPPFDLLLISIDTLRADHVGAYGHPRPTTPKLDALARESLRFETCVAHAPSTLASHGSLLTSLLPLHHGASIAGKTRLGEGLPTLAEVLSQHGWATASFNGGVQLDAIWGLDRGFDVYESARPHGAEAAELAGPEDRTAHVVDQAIAWLERTGSPTFVFLHSYEIHHPYTPDPEDLARFDADYRGALPDRISIELLTELRRRRAPLPAADLRHIEHAYDAELRSADRALGRLFDFLRATGRFERTLIVVTSDHGEEFGEHGDVGWHSHTLYDELLRVPLILRLPGGRFAGEVATAPARGIDVAPTVLAALGVAAPPEFAGEDLLARRGEATPARPALSHFDARTAARFSLRTPDWKLDTSRGGRLFDLRRDPGETRDVRGEHPERAAALRATAEALLAARERPAAVPAAITPAFEERLRALGYVE